jgi:uncharacterized protein
MRLVVAGGTGMLGDALTRACVAAGDEVTVLTRRARPARDGVQYVAWTAGPDIDAWAAAVDGADAVVNLAGASIAGTRWSNRRKVELWDSRLQATRGLAAAVARAAAPPPVVVSASAVGYYGSRGDERLTEDSAPGSDFLARLCVAWEHAAGLMASDRTAVACVRSGLVLSRRGGALPRIALPFRFGAGGRIGDGTQYMPWIHVDDWVALVRHIIGTRAGSAWNLTGPEPVTNAEFSSTLATVLRRPNLLPAPAFALRLALGEMADALLLASQRAVPARAGAAGVAFRYPTLAAALQAIYAGS